MLCKNCWFLKPFASALAGTDFAYSDACNHGIDGVR